ncbi:heme A synthase [Aquisalimonas sp.]|uniref:COX15/CtaA family protein n=1 Tax=Aquisalimonas sp. TaxID=1872621 RepID=UPI0025C61F49|nr:COX15/CtaA family protein [Aquisalimonas sp.]
MRTARFFRLCLAASILTVVVVLLGAWVRLEDAGLGCPDWPGCYGMLLGVPQTPEAIEAANLAHPERPVHVGKAWKEMIHRYAAGILGLTVLAMVVIAVRNRRDAAQPLRLPLLLGVLIVAQSVLGMWTVTWQLKPLVVTMHLLGGMATLALLWWLTLRTGGFLQAARSEAAQSLRPWVLVVLGIVVAQIALGGWVSTNYAALACTDFPRCGGQWWPEANYADAFVLWKGLGVDYEFGVLDHPARVAVHFVHRIGAVVTAFAVIALAVAVWLRARTVPPRLLAGVMVAVLGVQWALGITNVLAGLPLFVAVAHNGGAALLLLSVITLYHTLRPLRTSATFMREQPV